MNTQQAFEHLINNKPAWKAAGLTAKQVGDFRYRLRNHEISIEKMETVLNEAGFKIVQETKWITPDEWKDAIKAHASKINWPA